MPTVGQLLDGADLQMAVPGVEISRSRLTLGESYDRQPEGQEDEQEEESLQWKGTGVCVFWVVQ
jgi:hypothetical protein